MKKQLILILLATSLSSFSENNFSDSAFEDYIEIDETSNQSITFAPVGSGFNYQGELLDSGVSANTNFDFAFKLYDALVDGNQIGSNVIKNSIPVVNGLFTVDNIDFGDAAYNGDGLWLSVTVRETGNPNSETVLSPRQPIQSVPYAVQADYLGPLGASDGDILQFTGGKWTPSSANNANSPWTETGSNVSYEGTAEIGDGSSASVFDSNGILSLGVLTTRHLTFDADDIQARNGIANDPASLYLNFYGGDVVLSDSGSNTNVRGSMSVEEEIVSNAKITAPDSGDSDMKAYVYGRALSDGTLDAIRSSEGFTVSKTSTGLYKIVFDDTSINSNYVVVATTNSSSPKFATVVIGNDAFDLHVWDTNGAHSDHSFQFVVYRK